jgi:hypothetical protein
MLKLRTLFSASSRTTRMYSAANRCRSRCASPSSLVCSAAPVTAPHAVAVRSIDGATLGIWAHALALVVVSAASVSYGQPRAMRYLSSEALACVASRAFDVFWCVQGGARLNKAKGLGHIMHTRVLNAVIIYRACCASTAAPVP